jgi:LuxR family transcriptional regulator, maltose regulon positive regulatory protein
MACSVAPAGLAGHHPAGRFTQGESGLVAELVPDLPSGGGAGVVSETVPPGGPAGPVLVATKLNVPTLRAGMVSRGELVGRLAEAGERKLVLVCAPAGWGKTSVLSQWYSAAERDGFAWVSLDPGDDDRVRFWSYVIGAVRTVAPEVGEAALAALPNAAGDLTGAVLPSLINELAAAGRRLVLVLDDYHCVRNESIHASVAFFLRHLPANVQLAIATRADPPLPLGSLRAAGEVLEIRAAQLGFSDAEAGTLLNDSLALGLEPADVALLRDRTEGWPAGLRLAALSLRDVGDPKAFVAAFAGDDRQIVEYLQEFVTAQPRRLREFLLRTSILERLCGPACDAVTGRSDGIARLEEIQRANLFLVCLDSRGQWFRYHQLFRDLLRHELARSEPGLIAELHRRACAWYRAQGDADEAIGHATAAGDFAVACDLIARHWVPLSNADRDETIARWVDALPRESAEADARVCLARAWAALGLGVVEEMESWLRAAERAPQPGSSPAAGLAMPVAAQAALPRQVGALMAGDVAASRAAASPALAVAPEAPGQGWGVADISLGLALSFAGDLAGAEAALRNGLRRLPGDGWSIPRVIGLGHLALVRLDQGQAGEAEAFMADAERRIAGGRIDEAPATSAAVLARGRLLELHGDIAAAGVACARAAVLARRGGRRLELVNALIALARVKRRLRAHDEARAAAREARRVLNSCRDPGRLAGLLARTEGALQLIMTRAPALGGDPDLSERELAILRLLAGELSQREIGSQLYVSFNTVKSHTRSIFRKLGVSTRAGAVERARDLGFL